MLLRIQIRDIVLENKAKIFIMLSTNVDRKTLKECTREESTFDVSHTLFWTTLVCSLSKVHMEFQISREHKQEWPRIYPLFTFQALQHASSKWKDSTGMFQTIDRTLQVTVVKPQVVGKSKMKEPHEFQKSIFITFQE